MKNQDILKGRTVCGYSGDWKWGTLKDLGEKGLNILMTSYF